MVQSTNVTSQTPFALTQNIKLCFTVRTMHSVIVPGQDQAKHAGIDLSQTKLSRSHVTKEFAANIQATLYAL